jgi:predicted ATPase/class 3 adenylate cyclase
MTQLPAGTVALLFTDIEGSTRLLQRAGPVWPKLLETYEHCLRDAFERHRGIEVSTAGDAFFVVFASSEDAVAAAVDAQRGLAAQSWPEDLPIRVRIGIHTGDPQLVGRDYAGLDVHRAARVMAAGHGGQVLISQATRVRLPREVDVIDLGEHRLKDLLYPERLYQLRADGLSSEFPPLNTIGSRPTNLPTLPNPLIGRAAELRAIAELLTGADGRLVTLTGPGGTGKTRLALQAAAELLEHFSSGVFVVQLSPIRDPGLVVPTIAQTFALKEAPGQEVFESVLEYLEDKELLLVFDNFEQVVDAAPVVADLLQRCPGLKALVTSRAPLQVRAEREFPVSPLLEGDGVALFTERALAKRPDFSVSAEVREICRRLDCLPLAIELAAARTKTLSTAMILSKLGHRLDFLTGGPRDLPARQRTLHATIEWSYELLDNRERRAFARLAVFAGGFTAEAAEEVTGIDIELLDALVDSSLVRGGDDRFAMLETIREYAAGQLERSGDREELRGRHARFFLALTDDVGPRLDGPDQALWLRMLDREGPNIRAALEWAVACDDGELALRLIDGIGRVWRIQGRLAEGRYWLENALEHPARAEERAKGYMRLGSMLNNQGAYDEAARASLAAIELCRSEVDDSKLLVGALNNLGVSLCYRGDFQRAMETLHEALDRARGGSDVLATLLPVHNLGEVALGRQNPREAAVWFGEALAMARATDHAYYCVCCLSSLGAARVDSGDLAEAASALVEAIELAVELEDIDTLSDALDDTAAVAVARGKEASGARLVGAAKAIRAGSDAPCSPIHARRLARLEAHLRSALGEDRLVRTQAEGAELPLEAAATEAVNLLRTNPALISQ